MPCSVQGLKGDGTHGDACRRIFGSDRLKNLVHSAACSAEEYLVGRGELIEGFGRCAGQDTDVITRKAPCILVGEAHRFRIVVEGVYCSFRAAKCHFDRH